MYYPEGGTDLERAAMRFHKKGTHPTTIAEARRHTPPRTFITNGVGPVVGAPYHEPCRDDNGKQLVANVTGNFFSGEAGHGERQRQRFREHRRQDRHRPQRLQRDHPARSIAAPTSSSTRS